MAKPRTKRVSKVRSKVRKTGCEHDTFTPSGGQDLSGLLEKAKTFRAQIDLDRQAIGMLFEQLDKLTETVKSISNCFRMHLMNHLTNKSA